MFAWLSPSSVSFSFFIFLFFSFFFSLNLSVSFFLFFLFSFFFLFFFFFWQIPQTRVLLRLREKSWNACVLPSVRCGAVRYREWPEAGNSNWTIGHNLLLGKSLVSALRLPSCLSQISNETELETFENLPRTQKDGCILFGVKIEFSWNACTATPRCWNIALGIGRIDEKV